MIHLLYAAFERGYLAYRHALHHDKRKSSLAEVLHKLILPLYRVHIGGQIIQHIVVYTGMRHAVEGGQHQQRRCQKYRYTVLYYRFCEFHTLSLISSEYILLMNFSK